MSRSFLLGFLAICALSGKDEKDGKRYDTYQEITMNRRVYDLFEKAFYAHISPATGISIIASPLERGDQGVCKNAFNTPPAPLFRGESKSWGGWVEERNPTFFKYHGMVLLGSALLNPTYLKFSRILYRYS